MSNVSGEIYEQTIADSIPDGSIKFYLYIGSNLVSIPFNALKNDKNRKFLVKSTQLPCAIIVWTTVQQEHVLLKLIIWVL